MIWVIVHVVCMLPGKTCMANIESPTFTSIQACMRYKEAKFTSKDVQCIKSTTVKVGK